MCIKSLGLLHTMASFQLHLLFNHPKMQFIQYTNWLDQGVLTSLGPGRLGLPWVRKPTWKPKSYTENDVFSEKYALDKIRFLVQTYPSNQGWWCPWLDWLAHRKTSQLMNHETFRTSQWREQTLTWPLVNCCCSYLLLRCSWWGSNLEISLMSKDDSGAWYVTITSPNLFKGHEELRTVLSICGS